MRYTGNILAGVAIVFSCNVFAGQMITKPGAESMLKKTIAETPGCIVMDEIAQLPISLEEKPRKRKDRYTVKAMDAMASAGLLEFKKEKIEKETDGPMGFKQKFKTKVKVHTFSMTEMGKKFFREDAVQISKRTSFEPKRGPGFCYADKLEVTGIQGFVGPTTINYYVNAVDGADWSNNKEVIAASLIIGKTSRPAFVLKGQPAPPAGEKAQARFMEKTSGKGDWALTRY